MPEKSGRENLESSLLRHGEIDTLGKIIERGEKPPYKDFTDFMEGRTDPPIDQAATRRVLEEKLGEGKIKPGDFDIIICSPARRTRETAELINSVVARGNATVHPSEYLRELRVSMNSITPEYYAQAKDILEVRKKFMQDFLDGARVDEGIVDIYKRAETFLKYFRRIRKFTNKKPLFITHGIFARLLNLALAHQGETRSDEAIERMVREEFRHTRRPDLLEGLRISSSQEGIKIVDVL